METLKKFILPFSLLFGWVAVFTVLSNFSPYWIYYYVCLTVIILVLYDISRTEKTYWRFYYNGESYAGSGCIISYDESFPIVRVKESLKEKVSESAFIVSWMQISKNDYNKVKDERLK